MATKKNHVLQPTKQFSMMNFVKKTDRNTTSCNKNTSDANNTGSNVEKNTKFVFKSKSSTSSTWKPPLQKDDPNASAKGTSTPKHIPGLSFGGNRCNVKENGFVENNDNIDMFEAMGDDFEIPKSQKPGTNLSKYNHSRTSLTSTPTKRKSSEKKLIQHKTLSTPEKYSPNKKEDDPLRKLGLDYSISGFLTKINNHSALRGFDTDKNSMTLEDLEVCKIMYIELLEKISNAFDRIPQCIKLKFPGFDDSTYNKIKHLKSKLKNIAEFQHKNLQCNKSVNNNRSIERDHQTSPSLLMNCDDDFDDFVQPTQFRNMLDLTSNNDHRSNLETDDDLGDFDLAPSQFNRKLTLNNHNKALKRLKTSTPEINNFKNRNKQVLEKKSLSPDVFSPASRIASNMEISIQSDTDPDLSDIPNKSKGKFVYKKPSAVNDSTDKLTLEDTTSSTLDRLRNATEKLKPLPTPEPRKYVSLNNSSVEFQPQIFTKASLLASNCTVASGTSPITRSPQYELDANKPDFNLDINMGDEETVEDASAILITDSMPSTSTFDAIGKSFAIDDDGWPEYKIEDFEDDVNENVVNNTNKVRESDVVNLMEQSMVNDNSEKKYEGMGDFHAGTMNDGITGEFDGLDYPHSMLMVEMFKEKFGLKSFRPNQLQVINATLLGFDCFVLMPTGGGKSLCYQLPALLTPGVTIVISPLKSLILDQVNKLLSLDIPAAHLSGDVSLATCDEIYHKLSIKEPLLKLLYVTPEKISSSTKFQTTLDSLYARDKVARFVIDEAHCVSQWGHDFRPDYKKLFILRERFPKTTIMALTATANPRVRMDILHQLKVTSCKWFLCSFNRPNLAYRILEKKPKSVNQEVAKLIKEQFFRDSGIVYCLSRNECEVLSQELRKVGIQAAAYHAGLTDKKRQQVQAGWVADKYRVICATIAFGMGVDKADVRYVIHHSLPKSVEGYYQEAGRAGRDGEPATCLLLYSYCDVIRHRRMMDMDRNTTQAVKSVHIENLLRMVEVCESKTECRRAQVLAYLGETFTRDHCVREKRTTCDNCLRAQDYKPVDVTEECKLIVQFVREATATGRTPYTLLHVADALRGSMQQRIASIQKTPIFAKCKSWQRCDPPRLLRQLVVRGLLAEKLVVNNDIPSAYLILGPQVNKLMSGNLRMVFPMKCDKKSSQVAASVRADTGGSDSPIAAQVRRIEERCYADLVEACREMGEARGASLAAVLPVAALKAMSVRLPDTAADMLTLPHVTRANYDKYGSQLLTITSQYATEKLVLLMEYQDEMEQKESAPEPGPRHERAEWSAVSDTSSRSGSQRGRRYKRGGVRKRFKRGGGKGKALTATQKRIMRGAARGGGAARGRGRGSSAAPAAAAPSWKSSGTGHSLGSMPLPRGHSALLNTRPGVFNPSRLNLI